MLALLPVVAQQQEQARQPTFRSGVDVVAVDVHVVDGAGRPVPDLKPEEFAVTVDGKPRPIVAADYVSHAFDTSAAPQPPRPLFTSNWIGRVAAPGRTILLLVDEDNIRAGSARAAAQAAGQFLDRLQPADRAGLVVLPRTTAAIDPTTDRVRVRDALAHISGHLVSVNTQLDTIFALGVSEAFAKRNDRGSGRRSKGASAAGRAPPQAVRPRWTRTPRP